MIHDVKRGVDYEVQQFGLSYKSKCIKCQHVRLAASIAPDLYLANSIAVLSEDLHDLVGVVLALGVGVGAGGNVL